MILAPLLLSLTGVIPLTITSEPAAVTAEQPDAPLRGGYVALRKGRMTLITDAGVEPIFGELGDRDMARRGNLELGAISEAELRWAGQGSLRAFGPASIEWTGSPFTGDPLGLFDFRRLEVEVRSGELGARLPGGVLLVARRSALEVVRRSSGAFGVHHLGGQTAQLIVPAEGAPDARTLGAGEWIWIDPEEYLHEPRFAFPTQETSIEQPSPEPPAIDFGGPDPQPVPEVFAPEALEPEKGELILIDPVFVAPFGFKAEPALEPAVEPAIEPVAKPTTEPVFVAPFGIQAEPDPVAEPLVPSPEVAPEPNEPLSEAPSPVTVEPFTLPDPELLPDFWAVTPVPVDPLLKLQHEDESTEPDGALVTHGGHTEGGAPPAPVLPFVEQPEALIGLRVFAPKFPQTVPFAWMPSMRLVPLPESGAAPKPRAVRPKPLARASGLSELLNGLGAPRE